MRRVVSLYIKKGSAEKQGDIPDAMDNIHIALYLEPEDKYGRMLERLRMTS